MNNNNFNFFFKQKKFILLEAVTKKVSLIEVDSKFGLIQKIFVCSFSIKAAEEKKSKKKNYIFGSLILFIVILKYMYVYKKCSYTSTY